MPAASDGTPKAEEYYGTLLNFRETTPRIRDGFTELTQEWSELTKDIKVDEDAFAALLKQEIWSKLDPATYAR